MRFEEFATTEGIRLRAGLVAAYGPEVGVEAAADALAYAWEHWERVGAMRNPAGYLFRVGQSASRKHRRRPGLFPAVETVELPRFEPGLVPALEGLSESQRICIVLVHALGWTQTATAELLDVDHSTVRTHLDRGMKRLQAALEVARDAC